MSLRLRVVVAVALLFLTGSAVGITLAGWQANKVLRVELEQALIGGRLTVAGTFGSLARSDDPARDLRGLTASFDGSRHVRAFLVDAAGRVEVVSRPLPVRPAPHWFADMFHPGVAAMRLLAPAPGQGAVILAPVAADDIAAVWAEFLDLVAVLAAAFVIGAILVWLTVGRALRPLSDFSAAFERIGAGDYAARVRAAGPSELARVGLGVNEMAERLTALHDRTHRLEQQIATLQDEERADLARDLHDEIGPHLFAVNVDAAMARRLIGEGRKDDAARQVDAIQQSVAHMQRLVRDILGRLRPTEPIDLGLAAAIGELVDFWRARHPGIVFELKVAEDEALALTKSAREALYRVVQESLANAVRHGRPSWIAIDVGRTSDVEVFASIADNGAPNHKADAAGFGLIGMRERVAGVGGTLSISRTNGWTVTARLPVPARVEEFEEAP
ncbi:MAG: histidine kinase [Caulobacteraceae bacterium]